MRDKLANTLKRVQEALHDNHIGINKLERLSSETRKAFDNAIDTIAKKRNIREEIALKREQLRRWRRSVPRMIFPINWKYVLSMPFIYGMIVPAAFFHVCIEIYHQVCFRIYRIPLVRGSEYFVYDRQLLPYLNWLEKANCVYCSYVNNLIRYSAEIGGRTERYWCPIKYARRMANVHSQYPKFVDYLDAQKFREKWGDLREFSDISEKHEENQKKAPHKAAAIDEKV